VGPLIGKSEGYVQLDEPAFCLGENMNLKRFIAKEWLIILGVIGSGLLIAFVCLTAGVITSRGYVRLDKYNRYYFGRPIFEFRWTWRLITHYYTLSAPFFPHDQEWDYFFPISDDPSEYLKEQEEREKKKRKFSKKFVEDFLGERHYFHEKPGAKFGRILSTTKRDEKQPSFDMRDVLSFQKKDGKSFVKVTAVEIDRPEGLEAYISPIAIVLITAYAGLWLIRSIVWSVKYLRKAGKD